MKCEKHLVIGPLTLLCNKLGALLPHRAVRLYQDFNLCLGSLAGLLDYQTVGVGLVYAGQRLVLVLHIFLRDCSLF